MLLTGRPGEWYDSCATAKASRKGNGGERDSVRRFEHETDGIDWYRERRGEGRMSCWCSSGEGDCGSFEQVAEQFASEFSVLTFDMPGFSRSYIRSPEDISVVKLADQIAGLVRSLECATPPSTDAAQGGLVVLDLVIHHPDLVRTALVHEVAMAGLPPLWPTSRR
jgi:pimeloyl-ACP methyl ester carboxylesterase